MKLKQCITEKMLLDKGFKRFETNMTTLYCSRELDLRINFKNKNIYRYSHFATEKPNVEELEKWGWVE